MGDSDDDCVFYGSAIERPAPAAGSEDGAAPFRKKHVPVQKQIAVDSDGRRRFHGAFTGGFSAGYFNSVGSKEGWTPSTFRSSRTERASAQQQPQDFMDDEDMGEFGIAPKRIVATDTFAQGDSTAAFRTAKRRMEDGGHLAGPLLSLVEPAQEGIGYQLLRSMGWRAGQGIGARIVHRRPRRDDATKEKPGETSARLYGCMLPPSLMEDRVLDVADEGKQALQDERIADIVHAGETDEEDGCASAAPKFAETVGYAPKDTDVVRFAVKNDLHGLGYDARKELGLDEMETDEPLADPRGTHRGFGIGALEDDDDPDVYNNDTIANYDIDVSRDIALAKGRLLHKKGERGGSGHGGHGYAHAHAHTRGHEHEHPRRMCADGRPPLPGFILMTTSTAPTKRYVLPNVPKDFVPIHKFETPTDEKDSTGQRTEQQRSHRQMSATERAAVLDGIPSPALTGGSGADNGGSVFEYMRAEDAQRLRMNQLQQQSRAVEAQRRQEEARRVQEERERHMRQLSSVPPAVAKLALASNFKPFVSDAPKQLRYEHFLSRAADSEEEWKRANAADVVKMERDVARMTEWEIQGEITEFARSAAMFRPMNSVMASRFTSASSGDSAREQTAPAPAAEEPKKEAIKRVSRERFEWHPDNVLCKRFNAPNPHPNSGIVGVPGTATAVSVPTAPANTGARGGLPNLPLLSAPAHQSSGDDVDAIGANASRHEGLELPPKPAMDLFRAIFADSSDEDESGAPNAQKKDSAVLPRDAGVRPTVVYEGGVDPSGVERGTAPPPRAQPTAPLSHGVTAPIAPIVRAEAEYGHRPEPKWEIPRHHEPFTGVRSGGAPHVVDARDTPAQRQGATESLWMPTCVVGTATSTAAAGENIRGEVLQRDKERDLKGQRDSGGGGVVSSSDSSSDSDSADRDRHRHRSSSHKSKPKKSKKDRKDKKSKKDKKDKKHRKSDRDRGDRGDRDRHSHRHSERTTRDASRDRRDRAARDGEEKAAEDRLGAAKRSTATDVRGVISERGRSGTEHVAVLSGDNRHATDVDARLREALRHASKEMVEAAKASVRARPKASDFF